MFVQTHSALKGLQTGKRKTINEKHININILYRLSGKKDVKSVTGT